jgi:iron complex outermembrane recepter protein
MRYTILLGLLLAVATGVAQDSIPYMEEVMVRGFGQGGVRQNIPASVSKIGTRQFQRYGNISLVPAFNTVAGVRMEERSPGSYRLSIRGSLLRSPFGVRNVKVYWDDMPLTDAGGNTYLNLIDPNAIGSAEILKGPAGSIFGAGTGGVVTLMPLQKHVEDKDTRVEGQLNGGSFGMFGASAQVMASSGKLDWGLVQSHLQSGGYRRNSSMRRDLTQFNVRWKQGEKSRWTGLFLYGDLAYRTPGGLTLAQMMNDPRQARPATATLPSAEQQRAGIYNKTLFAGLAHTYMFSPSLSNTTSFIYTNTAFLNPFITNYERRIENGIGLRSVFRYRREWERVRLDLTAGAEWQRQGSVIDSSGNKGGMPDNNRVRDELRAVQYFLFTQADLHLGRRWMVQAGQSYNGFGYDLQRIRPAGSPSTLRYDRPFLPRIALRYRLWDEIGLYGSMSLGYSAPTLAEIRPSAGGLYSGLQAEYGWNYEAGIKGNALHARLRFDVTAFQFNLRDAIVRRVNAAGAEYFINAGGTTQRGLEIFGEWFAVRYGKGKIASLSVWSSASLFAFRFVDYKVNNSDHSGNKVTGVPGQSILAGADIRFARGLYATLTFTYTSSIPLNDSNDVFSEPFRLWQGRLGWKKAWRKGWRTDVFAGIDNAGNALYSLGHDINAFGRRYYNPAPARNYYGGLRFSL